MKKFKTNFSWTAEVTDARKLLSCFLTPALGISHPGCPAESLTADLPPHGVPLTEPSSPLSFKEKGVCVCVLV